MATKEQLKRLRRAYDEIADVQIEMLRSEDDDWRELYSLRGELNRWLYYKEREDEFIAWAKEQGL